jgi:hypothetical protein
MDIEGKTYNMIHESNTELFLLSGKEDGLLYSMFLMYGTYSHPKYVNLEDPPENIRVSNIVNKLIEQKIIRVNLEKKEMVINNLISKPIYKHNNTEYYIIAQSKINILYNKDQLYWMESDIQLKDEPKIINNTQEQLSDVKFELNHLNRRLQAKGGKRIAHAASASAYKSTGDKVRLLIDNKKLHRSIYVKGKAKYCKINNEFILLSKFKNKIID